ncbi:MAG TPA: shikimate dehydrogenase [Bacillales bacterium]|nr:shikimate dehydrogenase [Bacillales bacterium]
MGNLYALIGHPVGHSLSPEMHNEAFRSLGLPHHYESFDVAPVDLQEAIAGIKALGIAGFNITVPHKVEVMPYLDEMDEDARRIGAVNTVIHQDGRLIGRNTDGQGFLEALIDKAGEDLSEKRVLMIGAGGAARGVAVALDRHGVKQLDIANRTSEKAHALIAGSLQNEIAQVLALEEAVENMGDYDILINTTPVGMSPNTDDMPMPVDRIKPGAIMSDLIYNPLKTKWLEEGEKYGAVPMNGIGMFVNQGALAFEWWTGQSPDRERMRQTVLESLKGREHE